MHTKILKWVVFLTLLTLPVASVAMASLDVGCDIAVATSYGSNDVTTTVTWITGGEQGWHILDWGDGTEVGFQGLVGNETRSHTYDQSKEYTLVFTTDAVDGDESSCKAEFVVDLSPSYRVMLPLVTNGEPTEGFFCKIESKAGNNPNEHTAVVTWAGAKENWWLLYWGDEDQTHSEPPGFFGSSGTESFLHVYNSGIYTQKAVVENDDSEKYPCENLIHVP